MNTIKNFDAGAAIAGNRIVKLSADATVIQGAASTDALVGIADPLGAVSGARVDVTLTGVTEVELGGTVTRGAWLTSDSVGRGVAAAPASGVNAQVIGRALVSGVVGQIVDMLLAPGQIQGA